MKRFLYLMHVFPRMRWAVFNWLSVQCSNITVIGHWCEACVYLVLFWRLGDALKTIFSFSMAIPIPTTYYLALLTNSSHLYYNEKNCHFVIQTLGVCILWAGPDHHTSHYKTILQLLIVKSFSLLLVYCMSLFTPSTQSCFLGCELYGLHEWATTWFPATELYIHTWANRGELYELIIRQDHLHIDACLPGVSYIVWLIYAYIHVLLGWAMGYKWASSWSVWCGQS